MSPRWRQVVETTFTLPSLPALSICNLSSAYIIKPFEPFLAGSRSKRPDFLKLASDVLHMLSVIPLRPGDRRWDGGRAHDA